MESTRIGPVTMQEGGSGGTFDSPIFTGHALFPDGSLGAPSIANDGDTNTGIHWPAEDQLALGGGISGVAWRFDGSTPPGGPRSYINDPAGTKALLALTRGSGLTSGVAPDGTYTGALLVTSFQTAGGEAIKGSAYLTNGSGAGFAAGVSGVSETPAGSTYTPSGVYGNVGVLGQATVNRAGVNSARAWGGTFLAIIQAGDASAAVGTEIDVEVRAGATVQDRYGLQIVTSALGASGGTNEDIALKIANKNATAANRWSDALIAFSSPDDTTGAGWPAQAGATLIKAYKPGPGAVTARAGVDLEGVTFSDSAFRATNFMVSPGGRVAIKTTAPSGQAPLTLNASGDTFNFVLSSAVLSPTAGSAAGQYLVFQADGVTYKIQLFSA